MDDSTNPTNPTDDVMTPPTDEVEEPTEEKTPADEVLEDESTEETVETNEESSESPTHATPAAGTDGEEKSPSYATPNAVSSLMNLESTIHSYIIDIEKAQDELKFQRDMFNDVFNNDAEYSQIMQKSKEVNRLKAAVKQRLMKQDNVVLLSNKMKQYKEDIKEMQEALTDYLKQYQQMANTNQITSDNGEIREIVNVIKLVKRGAKKF